MKRALIFAAKAFLSLFVIIILVVNITLILNHRLRGDEYPNFLGWRAFSVATGSMQPTIMPGDLVLVRRPDVYKIDDIISFMDSESVVTHRIIGFSSSGWLTQGDMNNTPDFVPVPEHNILGTVRFTIPSGGIWLIALGRLAPFIALIVLLVLIYSHLVNIGRIKPYFGLALQKLLHRHLNNAITYAPTDRASNLASNILGQPIEVNRKKARRSFKVIRHRNFRYGTELRLKLPDDSTLDLATWLTDDAAVADVAAAATIAFCAGATASEITEAVADFAAPPEAAKKPKLKY
ncbi:signal peptidase I [Candidatus Saccharibacteria bacterium]|nr:signal peptidase I [Candidatus Saccharibacteria bacterium]